MNESERKLMLLGEAVSAVGQCCALLGADETNRIIAVIDQARDRVGCRPIPGGHT